MSVFYEGQEIQAIFWTEGSVAVGQNGVKKITVSMESGQMAGVHWFDVTYDTGKVYKYNGALAEGCELAAKEDV